MNTPLNDYHFNCLACNIFKYGNDLTRKFYRFQHLNGSFLRTLKGKSRKDSKSVFYKVNVSIFFFVQ
jgi:hypothetical protein